MTKEKIRERRHKMKLDLTKGRITSTLLWFALPMILGDMLQQIYNITDTLIVGRCIEQKRLQQWEVLMH